MLVHFTTLLLCVLTLVGWSPILSTPSPDLSNFTTTVVSGYWRVTNKHGDPTTSYDIWFRNSLLLNAPMVFFYEEAGVMDSVRSIRGELPTHFIHRPLSDFHSRSVYDSSWIHIVHIPSKELGQIWIEKVHFVSVAAALDVFNTPWFAWVDAGNAAYRDKKPPSSIWPDVAAVAQLPLDRVVYTDSEDVHHRFAGTAFMYHKNMVPRVLEMFDVALRRCIALHNDWRCGCEQCVFTLAMTAQPISFEQIGAGYGAVVTFLASPSFQLRSTSLDVTSSASASTCLDSSQRMRYAVVTMVSTPEYTVGANVLLFSLRKHIDSATLSQISFVALLINNKAFNDAIVGELSPGWQPCFVPLISPAQEGDVTYERFKEQFTKLNLWNMVGFTRILYLDSDTMATGDLSPMLTLDLKPFAAVHDWEDGAIREHFNMGVASLVPNVTEHERLDNLRLHKRDYRMAMAEQGLLNSVYGHDYSEMGFEFNGNVGALVQNKSFWDAHRATLRLIHFTLFKPFHYARTADGQFVGCDGECAQCVEALRDWWSMRDEMLSSEQAKPSGAAAALHTEL